MADNTTLNTGTGGDTIATDDISGVKYPRSKIVIGADGTNDGDVSATNPMPVKGTGTAGTANSGVLTVQGIASMTPVQVGDNAGSLTVDAPVGTPVFVRLSDGTSAITALPITDNGGSVTVDGSVSVSGSVTVASHDVTNAGTFAVQVSSSELPSGAATAANQTTGNTSLSSIDTKITVCDTGAVVLTTGTASIGKLAANAGVTIGAVEIASAQTLGTLTTLTGSGVAHDGVDSGNPHKVGAKATTALSGVTLVASGDRTDLYAGVDGVVITRPHCNLEDIVTGQAAITDGSSTSVISAAGSGVKIYITEVIIANSSSTNVTVDLRDGTAGSVKGTFSAPANGGSHKTLSTPLPFSANTAIAADPSAAASTVTITLIGFKSKV